MKKTINAFFTPRTRETVERTSRETSSGNDVDGGSRFSRCPVCEKDVLSIFLASHADGCEGKTRRESTSGSRRAAKPETSFAVKASMSGANAFDSMMAAQKERERVRTFTMKYDASLGRWRAMLEKTASTQTATWSGKVVVKEKLASGSTCTTTLKLIYEANKNIKVTEHDASILSAMAEAREVMDMKAKRAASVGDGEQLKVSVVKSALQKNVRRGRSVAATRVATHMSLQPDSFVELVRRLVIISLEDAILHHEVPTLTWLMCATSKGFQPSDAMRACVVRIAGEIAAVSTKDKVTYGAARTGCEDPLTLNDVEAQLPEEESTLVQSLIIRAHFGGMPGDVAMLRGFSRVWLDRFKEKTSTVPPEYDSLRNMEIIEESTTNRTPWLSFLEHTFEDARDSNEAEACKWGGFMRRSDIPIAAVDFHVSNCVENILQTPTIRLRIVDAVKELGLGDDVNATDAVKSAIWRHSAGVNFKRAIETRSAKKVKSGPETKPARDDELLLAIWDIVNEDLERWVTRYLAFRMSR